MQTSGESGVSGTAHRLEGRVAHGASGWWVLRCVVETPGQFGIPHTGVSGRVARGETGSVVEKNVAADRGGRAEAGREPALCRVVDSMLTFGQPSGAHVEAGVQYDR